MPLLTYSYMIKLLIRSLFSFHPSSLWSEPQGPITVSRSQLSRSLIYVVCRSMHLSSPVIFPVPASGLTPASCKSHPRVFLVHLTPWSQLLERPSTLNPNKHSALPSSWPNQRPSCRSPMKRGQNSGVFQLCQK